MSSKNMPRAAASVPTPVAHSLAPGDPSDTMQLYAAVVDMHKKGIAHGDLAPRNVVVQDGRVKLIDFGEAYPHECKREGEYGELEALREMLGMGV
ncbi:hypothetical protein NBRC10512v2_007022 [Rhodotorula toruloides]